jgi:hypothetical protein
MQVFIHQKNIEAVPQSFAEKLDEAEHKKTMALLAKELAKDRPKRRKTELLGHYRTSGVERVTVTFL